MTSNEQLIQAVEELRDLMTKVATGVERIPDVNDRFRRVYGVVASALVRLNISNPLPFGDLWDWYARWKEGDMPTYQSRRIYVADLFLPLLDQLRSGGATPYAPTGWARVDRTVDQYRERLATARTVEQYQTVGLLCREALISAAQAVYDPTRHKTADGVVPSQTDGKRLLEAFIAT